MKDLLRIIGERKTLLFFDLEATQITHECIEIGAYRVTLKDDLTVKKIFKPYHAYVRPKHRIGSVVTKLTGITEKTIADKGISYREMLGGLQKYLGKEFGKCLFVCYGDQDPRILQASCENNMDAPRDVSRFVSRHCFDFEAFTGRFIRDEKGNYLSLSHICELFGLDFEGTAHGAQADAKNLLNLYSAFLSRKDIVQREYEMILARGNNVPPPVKAVLDRLNKGQTVTPEDYRRIVGDHLK